MNIKVLMDTNSYVDYSKSRVWLKKISSGRRVNDSAYFYTKVKNYLIREIATYGLLDKVLNIEYLLVQHDGFNYKAIRLVKSEECKFMTHDSGNGFPDPEWLNNQWKPFIDSISEILGSHYDLQYGTYDFLYRVRSKNN